MHLARLILNLAQVLGTPTTSIAIITNSTTVYYVLHLELKTNTLAHKVGCTLVQTLKSKVGFLLGFR